jgi:spore germination cell wall hydrolase CwlJ-like protein
MAQIIQRPILTICCFVISIALLGSEEAWANCENKADSFNCLVCNCYFESKGEPYKGQVLVSRVVLERTKLKQIYPKTPCGVVYQNSQFSWTSSRSDLLKSVPEGNACYKAVREALDHPGPAPVSFHADYVSPAWARLRGNYEFVKKIGHHLFYSSRESRKQDSKNPTVPQSKSPPAISPTTSAAGVQ